MNMITSSVNLPTTAPHHRRILTAWVSCLLITLLGCSDSNNASAGEGDQGGTLADMPSDLVDMQDPPDDSVVDMKPAQQCQPNEVLGCRETNTPSIDVCAPDGSGPQAGSCPDGQVCREDSCVAVACIPGSRRCKPGGEDVQTPQECDEAGETFVDLDPCSGNARCDAGACLDRCEVARRTKSYIGCEYWAVELENHLLYRDGVVKDDQLPPVGIVLANPSDPYDAQVTVFDDDGVVADVVPSRVVGLDRPPQPSEAITFQTVYSEVVSPDGTILERLSGKADGLTLPPGAVMTLIVPHKRIPFGESSIGKFGYKVSTSEPVVAYQFNPLCCNYNTTNDASLLIPESALTQDYMYLGYAVFAGSAQGRLEDPFSATMTIVATEPDTQVTVRLPKPKGENRPYGALLYPTSDDRMSGPDAQGVLTATLQPFDVLNLGGTGKAPVEDLTGARIQSSKPVAAFSGHTCAYIPYTLGYCDHIESQLFPLETWGRRFVLSPLKLRNPEALEKGNTREATYWKFVSQEDDTRIITGIDLSHGPMGTLRPADEGVPSCTEFSDAPEMGIISLDAGETCEFGTRKMFVARANNPIAVGAFLSGQDSVFEDPQPGDRAGDPAFFFAPPEEQYRTSYTVLTPQTYYQNYVTVTILPGYTLTLDGETIDLTTLDSYEELPELGVARVHIPLTEGPHTMRSLAPFGIVVYGYDDYVSYAYTGGLNLTKLSEISR